MVTATGHLLSGAYPSLHTGNHKMTISLTQLETGSVIITIALRQTLCHGFQKRNTSFSEICQSLKVKHPDKGSIPSCRVESRPLRWPLFCTFREPPQAIESREQDFALLASYANHTTEATSTNSNPAKHPVSSPQGFKAALPSSAPLKTCPHTLSILLRQESQGWTLGLHKCRQCTCLLQHHETFRVSPKYEAVKQWDRLPRQSAQHEAYLSASAIACNIESGLYASISIYQTCFQAVTALSTKARQVLSRKMGSVASTPPLYAQRGYRSKLQGPTWALILYHCPPRP